MLRRFIALLAISLVFTLISCNKSGDSAENVDPELLGVWSWTEGDEEDYMIVSPDDIIIRRKSIKIPPYSVVHASDGQIWLTLSGIPAQSENEYPERRYTHDYDLYKGKLFIVAEHSEKDTEPDENTDLAFILEKKKQ